jgi:Protein of unknown function (DUF4244)
MSSWCSRHQRRQSTAEYAIGVAAARAFAGLLGWCSGSGWYATLLRQLLAIALVLSHVPRFML